MEIQESNLELRQEIKDASVELRTEFRTDINILHTRVDATQQTIIKFGAGLIATLVAGYLGLIATQI